MAEPRESILPAHIQCKRVTADLEEVESPETPSSHPQSAETLLRAIPLSPTAPTPHSSLLSLLNESGFESVPKASKETLETLRSSTMSRPSSLGISRNTSVNTSVSRNPIVPSASKASGESLDLANMGLKKSLPSQLSGGLSQESSLNATSLHGKESKSFYGLETYSSDGDSSDSDDEWISPEGGKANADKYEPKGGFGDGENSIVPEVAATIPVTDKLRYKALTFRVLLISTILCMFSSACAQFSFFRYNHVGLDAIAHIILSYPMGLLLTKLPKSWTWINPGHFNHKEHTLIVIICSTSISYPYQNVILLMQRLYLSKSVTGELTDPSQGLNIGYLSSLVFILASQCLGFGLGGLLTKFIVEPASMWWPSNLVLGNLIHSFHGTVTKRITSLRLKMFQLVIMVGFLFGILPGLLMPYLQSVSLLCLLGLAITKGDLGRFQYFGKPPLLDGRPWIGQIGSGNNGGGFLALSFDYSSVSNYAPMITPLWSTMNVIFANVALGWFITPLMLKFNFLDARTFPAYGISGYNNNGTRYDLTSILDPATLSVLPETVVPEFRMSANRVVIYGCGFAAISSLMVQFFLYYLSSVTKAIKMPAEQRDIHAKMMEKYPAVPTWVYLALTAVTLVGSILITVTNQEAFQLDWWGVPLALAISAIFALPIGIIMAISNQSLGLNILSQLLMGYLKPGVLLANSTFKVFGTNTLNQALSYASVMKLAYYMKIPPREVLFGIIYGTFISTIASYTTLDYLINNVRVIWDAAHGQPISSEQWNTQLTKVILTAGQLWGAVSPRRAFGPGSPYDGIYWCFLGGALVTVLFYLLHRAYPRIGFNYVNWPIIFESVGVLSVSGANGLFSTFLIAFGTQYMVRKYRRRWYDRYNYIVAAALDFVVALGPMLLFCLFDSGLVQPNWLPYYTFNPDPSVLGSDYCGNPAATSVAQKLHTIQRSLFAV
ncbi:hypothetical protein HDV03_001488 [Kappamyces sp. JEL0829]|nr:hypothetical protein HDV03_001488 [Kappamyces sp. JEL0829]